MLADHILEQAATESDGTPTRFADDIFATFQKVHVANLLKNLAELDSASAITARACLTRSGPPS
jgi:hypothetical protein